MQYKKLIPRVDLNTKKTWVNCQSNQVAINIVQLIKYWKKIEDDYFKDKEIICLSILPDDSMTHYLDLMKKLSQKQVDKNKLVFTSCDISVYDDWDKEENDEMIDFLKEDNGILFKEFKDKIKIDIGIIKGYDQESYAKMIKTIDDKVNYFMLYLTGFNASYGKHFNLINYLKENFPDGLAKPVYFCGTSQKQLSIIDDLINLNITVVGCITGSHILKGVYSGNPRYSYSTRIQQEWSKLEKINSGFD